MKYNGVRSQRLLNLSKGFCTPNRYDGNFDRVMAKSLKYSLFPVVPSAIEDNPTYASKFIKRWRTV